MQNAQAHAELFERPPRRQCCLRAVLSFGDYQSRVSGRVVNISATGAAIALDTQDAQDIVEYSVSRTKGRLLLMLPNERTEVEAALVWVNDGICGVHFNQSFRELTGRL